MAIPPRPPQSLVVRVLAGGLLVAAASLPVVGTGAETQVAAAPAFDTTFASVPPTVTPAAGDTAWWREGIAVFASLWDDARTRLTDDVPDWLQHRSRREPVSPLPETSPAYVVLQDDRADGMDVVTLRYRLAGQGPLRAYAGAGLNHARYFEDHAVAGPTLLSRRDRQSDFGATAEFGAELALNERVRLNADLRWADLDERGDLLQTADGPVLADPVMLGISLGYRFR